MTDGPSCNLCRDDCSWGTVVSRDGATASVELEGNLVPVALDLVPDAAAGDQVLVQHGFALERRRAP